MALDSIRMSVKLPAPPERVYEAWMSAREHTVFTGGGKATVVARVGGKHTAWDGYISGKNIELVAGSRIVQSWRTTEFPASSDDSRLEIVLHAAGQGTLLKLVHTNIPKGQGARYKQGWEEFYFKPMQKYFGPKPGPKPKKTLKSKAKPGAKKAAKARTATKAPATRARAKKPAARKRSAR